MVDLKNILPFALTCARHHAEGALSHAVVFAQEAEPPCVGVRGEMLSHFGEGWG